MRIHVYSRSFAPAIGGMEKLIEVLAGEFIRQGHEVVVVTETPGEADLPYPVIRQPGLLDYYRAARDADVILSAPLSLRRYPAQALSRTPLCIAHPVPFPSSGRQRLAGQIKSLVSRHVVNIVPSTYMAGHFPAPVVIYNPFDPNALAPKTVDQDRSNVIFVGRLVPEKGGNLLLEAFARARAANGARLTVVGDGPQRAALEFQADRLGIADRVRFTGPLRGSEVWAQMRSHRIMVVPSTWEEPFGIVALEGLACGCRMIVAESGGLPEAVGPLALSFARGDVAGLADCLDRALSPDDQLPSDEAVTAHLAQFQPQRIAAQYLAILEAAARLGRLAAASEPM